MRLVERVAALLRADAHGMVESLEERSLLLKQYLREAEIELDRNRARLQAMGDEVRSLRESLAREREAIEKLDQDVTLALDGGKEELARFAVRRLLSHRHEADHLALQIDQRETGIATLAKRVEDQEQRFAELRTRVRAEVRRETLRVADPSYAASEVASEEVELEIMRRRGHGVPS